MNSFVRKIYQTSLQDIYRHFAEKKRRNEGRLVIRNYVERNEIRKLHIGCGGNFLKGWLNSDLFPDNKRIALLDASETFPINDESFDYIFSEHVFEHLKFEQQLNFLQESFRILKSGGKMRLATPDFDFLIRLAATSKTKQEEQYLSWNMSFFLKNIPTDLGNFPVYVINNYFRDWGHQLIHNKNSLRTLTQSVGFEFISFEEVGGSSDLNLSNLEYHGNMITDEYNRLETMIMEVVKP